MPDIWPEVCARVRKHAGVSGIAFNFSTLIQHRWNPSVDWTGSIGQTDHLTMCQKRETLESTLYAMGLDYKFPKDRDPWYQRVAPDDSAESSAGHHDAMMAS